MGASSPTESPSQRTKPRVVAAVTLGHLGIDIFNSQGPVLLAFLQVPLGLSATQIGFAVGLYQFLAGATQPAFGWLVDRVGSRWLGPASVAFTVLCVCLAMQQAMATRSFGLFLALFAMAAIGSGAFHPQGTMHAGTPSSGHPATSTAVFFLFGQVGLAVGPALAGFALDQRGASGIVLLAGMVLPVVLFMAFAMTPARHNPPPLAAAVANVGAAVANRATSSAAAVRSRASWGVVALLALVFSCRAWVFIGTATFLPLLFQQRGWSSTRQGLLAGSFWLGGALTGVVAGAVADRWSRRGTVALSTGLGSVLLFLLPASEGATAFLVAVLCGALLGAPHSVLMVMAQALLPVRAGLASGLALGFLFAMGAVASVLIGVLAGPFGLVAVLQAGSVLALLAALLSLALPESRSS